VCAGGVRECPCVCVCVRVCECVRLCEFVCLCVCLYVVREGRCLRAGAGRMEALCVGFVS